VITTNPVRWNFQRGMAPLPIYVTAGAKRAQADLPGADILGAIERGIEGWNEVFGFEALKAVFVDDDRVPDADKNVMLVDYPGLGYTLSFADWRTNPNNGEIRGVSVYMAGAFFDFSTFSDDTAADDTAADDTADTARAPAPEPVPEVGLAWGDVRAASPRCRLQAPQSTPNPPHFSPAVARLSAGEKGSRYIQHVVTHEMGHALGLRHNFKASLLPGSSVMDYALDDDAIANPKPGPYDIAAIRYLYQQSNDLPPQPFCTDEDTLRDPYCARRDSGSKPLSDWWVPTYLQGVDLLLDQNYSLDWLDYYGLNPLLAFARDDAFTGSVDPVDRVAALQAALGRAAVPIRPEDAAVPTLVTSINSLAERVIRRVALDAAPARGSITFDLTDAGAIAFLSDQVGRMIRNEDGVRGYPLRRTGIDVLKALQADSALVELRACRDALQSALTTHSVPDAELALVEDLVARIVAAMSPYFD
jgi:hypothetical protein